MELIGSVASPFVRRIRILLYGQDYTFTKVNILEPQGAKIIKNYSPISRIPVLIDKDQVYWDSMLITKYLKPNLIDLKTESELIMLNELTDSGLQNFQFLRFNMDLKGDSILAQNNKRRIKNILEYFDNKNLSHWDIITQWLYCTLDWFSYREIYPWEDNFDNLLTFYKANHERPEIKETNPRIA